MSDDSSPDKKRVWDPDGDLLFEASERGTYKLFRGGLSGDDEDPYLPEKTRIGRPTRRSTPSSKVVRVRMTPNEVEVIEAAGDGNRSEYIRAATIFYARHLAKELADAPHGDDKRRQIQDALAALEPIDEEDAHDA